MNQALLARQTTETSLKDTIGVLKRRKWLIAIVMFLSLLAGGVVCVLSPNQYRSTALILVEGRANNTNAIANQDPLSPYIMPSGSFDVLTQIQVLQSYEVLAEAFRTAQIVLPPPGSDLRAPDVRVTQVGTTNVLAISVEADNRDNALRLATIIPTVYLGYTKENRQKEVDSAVSYLTEKLKAEQTLLNNAEKALEDFRRNRPMVALDTEGQELVNRLSRAQDVARTSETLLSEAKLRYEGLIAERKLIQPVTEIPNTQNNIDLVEQQKSLVANLKQRRSELLIDYLPTSPEVLKVEEQIKVAEQRLKDIPSSLNRGAKTRNPIANELDSQISVARANYDGARGKYETAKQWENDAAEALRSFNNILPKQNELKRAVENATLGLQTTARQLSELSVRQNTVRDPVEIISQASIPEQTAPKIPLIMSLFFIVGVVVSVALVSLRESLDDRVQSVQQAVAITNLPALGHVPAPNRSAIGAGNPRSNTVIESYRALIYNLLFSSAERPIKSVLVASSSAREGKSTVAINMAKVIASENRKVILVDANLRRPVIHSRLKLREKPGLTELVRGEVTLQEALQATDQPGLYVLSAGTLPESSSELLSDHRLLEVHELLKENADFVIIDSPAVLASADTQVLASIADGSLFVAQIGITRKGPLRYGIDLIRHAHATLLGVVYANSQGQVEAKVYDETNDL
ncbi:MAG: polysaccharide biosynthesis tyrosine autokinase [Fimbriimonas sp.]